MSEYRPIYDGDPGPATKIFEWLMQLVGVGVFIALVVLVYVWIF